MTQKLFGLDLAKIVSNAIKATGDVRDVTLTKTTPGSRTIGQLTAGTNPTTVTHTCKGFVSTAEERRANSTSAQATAIVSIFGATVNSGTTAPEVNDLATIDGETYLLTELLEADPAGALYEFAADKI